MPSGLSDTNRTAGGFANIVNNSFGSPADQQDFGCLRLPPDRSTAPRSLCSTRPSLPGEPGKWLIPNDSGVTPTPTHPFNAFIPGTGRFKADMAVANSTTTPLKRHLSLKYYYQHDPTLAPYAYLQRSRLYRASRLRRAGLLHHQHLLVKSNLSTTQTLGFMREKTWVDNEQPFGPASIPGGSLGTVSINTFGSNYFPGVSIVNVLGDTGYNAGLSTGILNIGPNAEGQAPNTGAFQNRWQPSGNAIWTLGKHTVSFGANYSYTQLNTIDKRTGTGTVATDDLSAVRAGLCHSRQFVHRFLRQLVPAGQRQPLLSRQPAGQLCSGQVPDHADPLATAGVRYDWDGGLTEK